MGDKKSDIHSKSIQSIKDHFKDPKNVEEARKFFEENRWDKDIPHGWVSIEDHLPMMMAMDLIQGGTTYKVKYEDGMIDETTVMDHQMWYYQAKDAGITHWWYEKDESDG